MLFLLALVVGLVTLWWLRDLAAELFIAVAVVAALIQIL
jgi:hypothetical protein